jgi:hypothetical protein
VVDDELCCFIVPFDGAFVQDASLMLAPCSRRKDAISKCRFHARPRQHYVQDVLRVAWSPMEVPQTGGVVGGVMPTEASQLGRPASSNQLFIRAKSPAPAAWPRSSGGGPNRG